MRRREFIAGLGSTAAWPLAAWAQQGDRVRRIGVLSTADENAVAKTRISAFTQALADLGWTDGRNLRIDLRWGGGGLVRHPTHVGAPRGGALSAHRLRSRERRVGTGCKRECARPAGTKLQG
jgi:hypothetical protein